MAIIWNINNLDEIISRIKKISNLDEETIEHLIDYVKQSPWMLDEKSILDYSLWFNDVSKDNKIESERSSLFPERISSARFY